MAAFTPVSFPENDFEVVNQESSDSCVEAETKLESSTGSFQVVETAGQVDLSGQPIIASLRVATISHETTAASAMIVNETCSSNPEIAQDERGFCRQVDIAAIQNMTILRSKPSVSIEVNSSSAAICEEIAQGSDVASLYKIANSIDHDEAENEQINHPGHVLLNRHIYTIYGPGVLSGDKLIGPVRVGVESINCPYWKWPLYNDFKEIRKETKESLPPPYVNLQDWHILQIHYAGVSGNLCGKLWPADFNSSGVVRKNRKPKGRAGKVRYGGAYHYAVVFGDYQLSGDEASQVVVLLPPNTDAIPNQLRTTIGTGQLCEAEEEFEPTFEELRHGMYTSRLREPALQRRPLNNCGNWGPENRNGQPPSIKVIKKVAAKEKHKNPALEDASKTVPKTKKGIANRVQRNQPAPNNASDKATAVDKDDQEPVPLTRIGSRKRSSSDFSATANKVTKRGKLDSPATTTEQTIIGKDTVAKENKSYRISPSSSRSKKNQKRIYEAGEDDNILKCDDKDNLRAEEPKFAGKQSFPGGRIITHNSAHSRENAENIITFLAIQTNLLTQCIRDTAEYDNHLVKGALLSTARQTLLSIEQQSKQYLAKATTELSEATSKAK